MPKRPQIELTKEELDRAEIPMNHVLIKMVFQAEGATTKSGVIIGFNEDDVYAEGDDSHSANLAEVYGIVEKVPQELYFNPDDPKSMDWETDMELEIGDMVWYSVLEAKNSVQLICEGVLYKSVPYQDCYVAKRKIQKSDFIQLPFCNPKDPNTHWRLKEEDNLVTEFQGDNGWKLDRAICLNGYVLCSPVYFDKISPLDAISDTQIDMTRGKVAFVGKPVKTYKNASYSHIDDLRVGDEVLLDKNAPLFYLERSKQLATFDGDNQYWVTQRRRIAMVLNR